MIDVTKMNVTEFAEMLNEGWESVSNIIHYLQEWTKDLQHYHDSSVGLWCTDRPDLVQDPEKIMFQLKALEEKEALAQS